MSALTDFLAALAAIEATVIPEGSVTPIGAGNTYALQPKPTATAPLVTPCVLNFCGEGDTSDLAQRGYDATEHKVQIFLYTCPLEPDDAWLDSQPYLMPLRLALRQDIHFNGTCSHSQLGSYKQGYFKYRGRWYYGIKQDLLVLIHDN